MKAPPLSALAFGASAGGVEALGVLLPRLRPGCGVSVFVVVHLPRERPSLLSAIFSAKCALRVAEAQDKEPIEPETIYFAPPDYHLLIDDGPQIALDADELVNFSRPSVDVLFESVADAYGPSAAGFVLTGANQDGARGLAAIAKAGGLTIVQDPTGALTSTMPSAALRAAPASRILRLESLATLLGTLDGGHFVDDCAPLEASR
jgi:two-component system, chemotaxis family, protein-glutamate methylesterase/glutaminase